MEKKPRPTMRHGLGFQVDGSFQGTAQYHINADIMYAMKKCVNAMGDEEFLKDYRAEMLDETVRLCADLGFFSERKGGQFCINGVTGPDEYNTIVDNNVFTNLMARENLHYAVETIKWLQEKDPNALSILQNKTQLDIAELDGWTTAAETMYIPFDEKLGVHPQDGNFLAKKRRDFEHTPKEKYPLLLFFSSVDHLSASGYQASRCGVGHVSAREEFMLE